MYHDLYLEKEFYTIAEPIIKNREFLKRKNFMHHDDSVYEHSLKVAWISFKIAKAVEKHKKVNVKNVVIGALLHDFYTTPWREYESASFFKKHGFVHGKIALCNAYKYFPDYMNARIDNTIKRHMFPLTLVPPRYIEGWIITLADKYVSLEILKNPKELPRYVGIQKPSNACKNLYKKAEYFVSHIV